MKVVSLKLLDEGRIKRADSNGIDCNPGNYYIIESPFGEEIGMAIRENEKVQERWKKVPLEKILREASEKDMKFFKDKIKREEEAFKFCREKIADRGMPMKLIKVKFFTSEKKVMFFFSAEGRIDFRDLVKDLAKKYRMRIEMRQIGIRDEAKMMGGVGICGRFLCCMGTLKEFKPVSSNLLRSLDIKVNPNKISGLCGRLMCCLSYEMEVPINLSDIVEEEE